ncbi:MAG TPA: FAD-binding oxidoreductase [Myxococcota bacterium]|nr:FAD-binding oxidoreductase [Myxococcota bacterium]
MPFGDVASALAALGIGGFNDTSSMRLVVGSSTQPNALNQDLGGTTSTSTWPALGAISNTLSAAGGFPVPEPGTGLLLGLGLCGLAGSRRRARRWSAGRRRSRSGTLGRLRGRDETAMVAMRRELSGWGRLPVVEGREEVAEELEAASARAQLSRGLGRSYGDASLPASSTDRVLCTRRADRILHFDPASGVLRAEAGLSLRDIHRIFGPRGFASPVLTGTAYVTLGGMVASDVHGKNQHVAGTLGAHVRALRMRVADGRALEVTDESEPDLFRATQGGMGLTGHVLEVEVALERVESPWLVAETRRADDLDTLVDTLQSESRRWPHAAAWVDCTTRGRGMGRGYISLGRYAARSEAPSAPPRLRERVAVPFDLPGWVVAPWSIRIFNTVFHHLHRNTGSRIVSPQPFFHPLDFVRHWNRLYGRRGFAQYQCVLPHSSDGRSVQRFFEVLTRLGGASPVSVLKNCGPEGRGVLSFPMPGISVALDLPFRRGHTQALVDALNEVVIESGGRIYLTKDALTRPEHLRAMEPRLARFQEIRRKWDPDGRLRSALSVRLLGDAA